MAQIQYVRASKNKGRLTVGISDRNALYTLSVSESSYFSLGEPTPGAEIGTEELRRLFHEDEVFRAMKKALSILSYADNNRKNLYIKLVRAGFSRDVSSDTVKECVRLGYVNEQKQLMRICLREANTALRGPALILRALVAKGYSAEDIKRALFDLCRSGEIDFSDNFKKLCEKKGASLPAEISRLRYQYGFENGY